MDVVVITELEELFLGELRAVVHDNGVRDSKAVPNIANCALVSTYISQVTGNHPTSTGLSIAKHTLDPGPT